VTRAGVKVLRGGAKGKALATGSADLEGSYDPPDIITELQEATSLTRKTIVDILIDSGRLGEFVGNPNDFIAVTKRALQSELAMIVVYGIPYERDGEEERSASSTRCTGGNTPRRPTSTTLSSAGTSNASSRSCLTLARRSSCR
jgi:restriction endonuclease